MLTRQWFRFFAQFVEHDGFMRNHEFGRSSISHPKKLMNFDYTMFVIYVIPRGLDVVHIFISRVEKRRLNVATTPASSGPHPFSYRVDPMSSNFLRELCYEVLSLFLSCQKDY